MVSKFASMTIDLGQGNTPLVSSTHIGPELGLKLFFKLENCNPSGSYKDRFIAAEIAHLKQNEVDKCIATSSGNTGSSLAAYCARYGLTCAIVVNESVPAGKLEQMQAHGAHIFRVRNFINSSSVTDAVYSTLSELSRTKRLSLVVSAYRYCPHGMAGVERLSEELSNQLESVDHVFVPVGGGGLLCAVCRGFASRTARRPKIHAVQPSGCPTVVSAFARPDGKVNAVESVTSISGLSVPLDLDAGSAVRYLREFGGHAFGIKDEKILAAQRIMLHKEGIFCEPAGAAATAGLRPAMELGLVRRNQTVVCLVTGHGFKDPKSISSVASAFAPETLDAGELQSRLARIV